jgi:hypothetical protein
MASSDTEPTPQQGLRLKENIRDTTTLYQRRGQWFLHSAPWGSGNPTEELVEMLLRGREAPNLHDSSVTSPGFRHWILPLLDEKGLEWKATILLE